MYNHNAKPFCLLQAQELARIDTVESLGKLGRHPQDIRTYRLFRTKVFCFAQYNAQLAGLISGAIIRCCQSGAACQTTCDTRCLVGHMKPMMVGSAACLTAHLCTAAVTIERCIITDHHVPVQKDSCRYCLQRQTQQLHQWSGGQM